VPPTVHFKTKIWHPQVREDGFGRFWMELEDDESVRDLLKLIYMDLSDVNEETTYYINKQCQAEFENENKKWFETATKWTADFADDEF